MELDMTNTIGAIAITMKQLGFDGKDIDLTIYGILRIQKRCTSEDIEQAGIAWIAKMLPTDFFRGSRNKNTKDVLQDLSDDFDTRIRDIQKLSEDKL